MHKIFREFVDRLFVCTDEKARRGKMADAAAVANAIAVGAGASVDLSLGGHSDDQHGAPLMLKAKVLRLGDGFYTTGGTYMTGQRFAMGKVAVFEVGQGIRVLATERATPPFHVEQLTSNGIDPASADIIVVKGAVAWRSAFSDFVADAIEVDTPGCCPANLAHLKRATTPRPVAPMLTAASSER